MDSHIPPYMHPCTHEHHTHTHAHMNTTHTHINLEMFSWFEMFVSTVKFPRRDPGGWFKEAFGSKRACFTITKMSPPVALVARTLSLLAEWWIQMPRLSVGLHSLTQVLCVERGRAQTEVHGVPLGLCDTSWQLCLKTDYFEQLCLLCSMSTWGQNWGNVLFPAFGVLPPRVV